MTIEAVNRQMKDARVNMSPNKYRLIITDLGGVIPNLTNYYFYLEEVR